MESDVRRTEAEGRRHPRARVAFVLANRPIIFFSGDDAMCGRGGKRRRMRRKEERKEGREKEDRLTDRTRGESAAGWIPADGST